MLPIVFCIGSAVNNNFRELSLNLILILNFYLYNRTHDQSVVGDKNLFLRGYILCLPEQDKKKKYIYILS